MHPRLEARSIDAGTETGTAMNRHDAHEHIDNECRRCFGATVGGPFASLAVSDPEGM
jgi:hypothetical protein